MTAVADIKAGVFVRAGVREFLRRMEQQHGVRWTETRKWTHSDFEVSGPEPVIVEVVRAFIA